MTQIIELRARTHGDYEQNASTAQSLKEMFRQSSGWGNLKPQQRESLDLIATKLGRILSGDPQHADHWLDLGGYAKLGEDACR